MAVKTGEGDPRDADGRVQTGPEHLTILDGLRQARGADRLAGSRYKLFDGYNHASRNQLGVAYLDGRTPRLIVERGTYGVIVVVAYRYASGKLTEAWRWDNRGLGREYRGGGAGPTG